MYANPREKGESMKKKAALLAILALTFSTTSAIQAHAGTSAGAACPTVGKSAKVGSVKYICQVNSKTKKKAWAKIVLPAGFSCSATKSGYANAQDMVSQISTNLELLKGIAPATDPNLIDIQKQYNQALADLTTIKDAITKYC